MRLSYIRKGIQAFFLLLILYAGVIGIRSLSHDPEVTDFEESAAASNDNLKKDTRPNVYLPIKSCKNTQKDQGLARGCGVFMFSEIFTFKTFAASAFPLFIFFGVSFLFGRTLCGWVCPLGFIQEILDSIRGFFRINYIKLSRSVVRMLRRWRYIWLSIILMASITVALPIFASIRKDLYNIGCSSCPTRYILMWFPSVRPSLMSFNTTFYKVGAVIVIIFLCVFAMSFFVRRFWCRICPNGALLSLFNKGCLTEKVKDIQKCTKCGICYQVCPVDNEDVYTVKHRKVVNSKNCVMCFECVDKCPENGCLTVRFAGKDVIKSKWKR